MTAAFAAAQQNNAAPQGDAANGKALFVKVGCYQCHGYAGQGGGAGARLAQTPLELQDVIDYVRHPEGEMPVYTAKSVSDKEMADIYAYIRSLPAPKPVAQIPLLKKLKDRQ